ncbi:glycoside hydrolase family 36 protein [Parapedobacter sp. 10938]|uniref:glycoside hydrolase family 36 protein n=1 Tax=Parapedobacter flavus TaxID=3110225 RepID=UPI002DBA693C|nr:glycoside hydrolase family 36 protein [Parapedobacter sp. 10938]MEC3878484.1 glycoside hydrolase family 36 protein [Parapedobacter sp. 10938]
MRRISLFLIGLLCCGCAVAQTSRSIIVSDPAKWLTQAFAKGKLPPFSFEYNGQPSATFIKKWKHAVVMESSADATVKKYTISYTDPNSELRIDCKATAFADYNAVEWVLHFTNGGRKNSAQIRQVNAVDLSLEAHGAERWNLYASDGSDHDINDFRLRKTPLLPGSEKHMKPQSGRSSDKTAFPFFNVEAEGAGGVIAAIGWTGTWFADIVPDEKNKVALQAGMENTDLFLYPGESIRTPLVAMLFWHGKEFIDGHNQFRQFVLDHHSRKIDGRFAEYPLSGGFEWGDPAPCNEYTCLTEEMAIAFVKRYEQFGIMPEVMWLDAGWYAGSGGPNFSNVNWWNSIGTWRVDTTRFPNGLKPLSDVVHKAGAKFMVWFEPERVMAGSELATRFPQWMLKREGEEQVFLYDLSNTEAREWLSKYIGDFLEENGIDYYRQDFNMSVDAYWAFNDEVGRKGMTEIRYVEGLYAYWDYLLQRFPNLLIDNCASGGRRIDLETTSRSAPLWRTDYSYGEPNGYQNHTYGLNFYLPLHGTGVFGFDDYSFHSAMSSAMVLNWDLTARDGDIGTMRRQIAQFKELRPYYYEDYYPLTGLGDLTTMDVWIAYQLNRSSDQSGVVVAFRRKDNGHGKTMVKLRGLSPDSSYDITNLTDQSVVTKTGREMMDGLELELTAAPGSLVLRYMKK